MVQPTGGSAGVIAVDLSGRRVLVTGASSGIGADVSRSVVAAGGAVAMLARRKERLAELSDELGERSVGIPCDVTVLEDLDGAVGAAATALGGLDAIVAVAGRGMVGTIASGSPERWRDLMELNLLGPLAAVKATVPHFEAEGRRDVILVGSTGALTPMAGTGIYAATKRGLRAAFDALRLELAPSGVNVSYVMPGMFDTEGLMAPDVVDGEVPPFDAPMFVDGSGPAPSAVLGDVITMMLGLPPGVCINELVIRPTGQLLP
jgi:NADP-dependent 3-hydroxy acid dehydrogenase YdfG